MSNRGEMWVHGSSVIVQYPGGEGASLFTPGHRMLNVSNPESRADTIPWTDMQGYRTVQGATFKGALGTTHHPNENWFHFSIPTPAIFPQLGVDPHLEITVDHVSLYYRTVDDHVTIQDIAVSDGGVSYPVHGIGGARLFGDHGARADDRNHWRVGPFTLALGAAHGILVSALVRFEEDGVITFTAAGFHYQVGP